MSGIEVNPVTPSVHCLRHSNTTWFSAHSAAADSVTVHMLQSLFITVDLALTAVTPSGPWWGCWYLGATQRFHGTGVIGFGCFR